ncbi:hypothetical protein LNP74_31260 [Klebsiella pneumoniae subsp. pneumoniae]|nr:hypothetical protein [Klebsiella pneumoniae subsp. pneumoniae]
MPPTPGRWVETLFSANYPQATSVLASSAAGCVNLSDKLTFDWAKARQLLDDAGWRPAADGIRSKDGQRLALTRLCSRCRSRKIRKCCS